MTTEYKKALDVFGYRHEYVRDYDKTIRRALRIADAFTSKIGEKTIYAFQERLDRAYPEINWDIITIAHAFDVMRDQILEEVDDETPKAG